MIDEEFVVIEKHTAVGGTVIGEAPSGGKKGLKPQRWSLVPPVAKRILADADLEEVFRPFANAVCDFEEEPSIFRAYEAAQAGMYLLVDLNLADHLPVVYGEGAVKYKEVGGTLNFLKGYPFSWSIDALWRHLFQETDPDPESGHPAVVHAVWHALTLNEFLSRGVGTDDLPYAAK